jgi:hypothetical protein
MADIEASCSSGCAVMNGSIRDRLVPVKGPKRGPDGTGQELSFQILAVRDRTHDGLEKDTPATRAVAPKPTESARLVAHPRVGGLHHRYEWQQAA